ncbi:sortase domain-containing protein [Streptomyces ochraceiscleroticus]|uniref:sortase domain-containing protein n=1 Tax=Streptomyces ochraceiscleroticus TaxID=47761 RepID=UPI000AF43844|nr:sortase [Streptomyces ochraceiscleroticus]
MVPSEGLPLAGGYGRLLAGVAWALLLLGLWIWGRGPSDGQLPGAATTGDVAAVGRPLLQELPRAHDPLPAARPTAIGIGALGTAHADVVPAAAGAPSGVLAPPARTPGAVAWNATGPQPGRPGVAVLAGHGAAGPGRGVFAGLGEVRAGETVRVARSDGSIAEFTVEEVQAYSPARFDAARITGAHERGRAELRLVSDDRIVVSAYLSAVSGP